MSKVYDDDDDVEHNHNSIHNNATLMLLKKIFFINVKVVIVIVCVCVCVFRCHTFGVGPDICQSLIAGIAEAGQGRCVLVQEGDRLQAKVCVCVCVCVCVKGGCVFMNAVEPSIVERCEDCCCLSVSIYMREYFLHLLFPQM